MTTVAGNTGPKNGNEARRSRNTVVNQASKNYPGGYQAPVSSAGAVGYGDQLAAAQYQYLSQLAALKAQRPVINQQFQLARADARGNAVADMAANVNSALDRGLVGSSVDLGGRAAVLDQQARAVAAAQAARTAARMGLAQQGLDVRGQYYNSVASIQNAIAQEQMANTIGAFQNNQFDALTLQYKALLEQLKAQKNGQRPRGRTGVQPANAPYYQSGVGPAPYVPLY